MEKCFKIALCLVLMLVAAVAQAQPEVQMADGLRAEGKIYVVVAIVLIVLAGLVTYLFLMDRKVKKLEQLLDGKDGAARK